MDRNLALYSNKFKIALNEKAEEVVLIFYQDQPVYNQSTELIEVASDEIVRIVMTTNILKLLTESLNSVFEESAEEPAAEE